MLHFVDDVVDDLGSRNEIEYIKTILENNTGAERQLKVYNENDKDTKAVVDYIIQQTALGI